MDARYKLRFPSREALNAALALETAQAQPVLINRARRYIAFEPGGRVLAEAMAPQQRQSRVSDELAMVAKEFGAEKVVDFQYELEMPTLDIFVESEAPAEASLPNVIELIKADKVWGVADGTGVTIAIVDTGIHAGHSEFPVAKRDGGWAVPGDDPWSDWQGHGTMCACIAAATADHGGKYRGVAPGAKIMSCKTHFYDSELAAIYDVLTARAKEGTRIVASNSFGLKIGSPPQPDPNSDFLPALDDAVEAGIVVVFSAGNNHQRAGGSPTACSPNSIWLHKSRADVLAVATCQLDRSMWYYSSRGPGQHFGDPHTDRKPDVTAPTPKNGRILYGAGESVLANGWGTSGACPQVAGLAALLISANPGISRADVSSRIKTAAQSLGLAPECQGSGIIDCEAALATG